MTIREAAPDDAEQLVAYIHRLDSEPDSMIPRGPGEFLMTVEAERGAAGRVRRLGQRGLPRRRGGRLYRRRFELHGRQAPSHAPQRRLRPVGRAGVAEPGASARPCWGALSNGPRARASSAAWSWRSTPTTRRPFICIRSSASSRKAAVRQGILFRVGASLTASSWRGSLAARQPASKRAVWVKENVDGEV